MNDTTDEESFHVEPQSLLKIPTHIKGLDEVLHGGIPKSRLTIINGGPGAGKTIVGLELLVRGTESGQSAIFISFEETREAMRRNALSLGWDLAKLEEEGKLVLINPEIDYQAVSAGEFNIEGLCAILEGQAKRLGANLVVIDAVDMLMRLFNDADNARNQLIDLHRCLNGQELTAVMTVKAMESDKKNYAYLDFMADCVINLNQRIVNQVITRRLHVAKYRGSDFASREHPFVITKNGIVVMPLTFVDHVKHSTGEFVSSGDTVIDEIFGGGYRKGSSILISGPSGSGKTTMTFILSVAAAKRGEKVLFLSFEESEIALCSEMLSVGLNLKPFIKNETLRITSVMPESMGMEEHLYRIVTEIDEFKPQHIILDAISATNRIGSKQSAMEFLIRLYNEAKKRRITCIFTNQTILSKEDDLDISGLEISSIVDSVILLNLFKSGNHVARSLLVLKSRGTHHSNKYHEFIITDDGISIEYSAKH
ncbi:MAG: circadian clock protein KaiC [Balneolaceae bacterium]